MRQRRAVIVARDVRFVLVLILILTLILHLVLGTEKATSGAFTLVVVVAATAGLALVFQPGLYLFLAPSGQR